MSDKCPKCGTLCFPRTIEAKGGRRQDDVIVWDCTNIKECGDQIVEPK